MEPTGPSSQARRNALFPDHSTLPALQALLLIALLPLFFLGGPDWTSSLLYKSAWNLGHILYFAVLTLWLKPRRWLSGWVLWCVATMTTLAIGAAIEVIQGEASRDASVHDLFRNLIGCWLALAWHHGHRPGDAAVSVPAARSGQWLLRIAVTALLVTEVVPVITVASQAYQLSARLPVLYDFSQEHPDRFWSGPARQSPPVGGSEHPVLEIQHNTERYSGVSLDHMASDWSAYHSLRLVLFNPGQTPLNLTLRINDVAHDRGSNAYSDRFNVRLRVQPGRHSFSISLDDIAQAPADRTMAMDDIRRIGLFTTELPAPRSVYLLELRLQ